GFVAIEVGTTRLTGVRPRRLPSTYRPTTFLGPGDVDRKLSDRRRARARSSTTTFGLKLPRGTSSTDDRRRGRMCQELGRGAGSVGRHGPDVAVQDAGNWQTIEDSAPIQPLRLIVDRA